MDLLFNLQIYTKLSKNKIQQMTSHFNRFVSLLGYEKHPTISGTRSDMWCSMHSFVATGKGVSTKNL